VSAVPIGRYGNPGLGPRMTAVAITCVVIALSVYGVWSLSLRRSNLENELQGEEKTLAMALRLALESGLQGRDPDLAADVLERFTRPDRVHGIALRGTPGGGWVASASLSPMRGRVDESVVRRVMASGADEQLRETVDGRPFLVHLVPLDDDRGAPLGVAEIWRDLTYIDVYIGQTAWRLVLLAFTLQLLVAAALAIYAHRAISRPARRLVDAMQRVTDGDLEVSVLEGGVPSGEFGDVARSFDDLARSLREARTALEQGRVDRDALVASLRRSERLATLGGVVAEVAHEVGTPLNVINGRARQLMEWTGDDAKAQAAAKVVHEQGTRIAGIFRRLLDLTRERRTQKARVDLLAVARSTASFLGPEFDAAGVGLEVAPGVAAVSAESDQMQQVLVNLLSNALHASRRGDRVSVLADVDATAVTLRVQDQGTGVDPSVRDRLFEPFVTTKPPGEGTGLGLSIVRALVEQSGGRVVHRDTPPGSTFEAVFPPFEAAAHAAREVRT